MSTVITSDKHYKAIANEIRTILGTTTGYKPSEIPQAVLDCKSAKEKYSSISYGLSYKGEKINMIGNKLIEGMFAYSDITSFTVPENITSLPLHIFSDSKLSNIILHDNITSFGDYCFYSCDDLKTINFPNTLTTIGYGSFYWSSLSGHIILPNSVTYIGDNAFTGTDIVSLDIPKNALLDSYSYSYFNIVSHCDLVALILRKDSGIYVNNYTGTNYILSGTPIRDGTGYIYVPSTLLESYKTANGWSVFASQFRALEDYTVDGTTTGAFDYNKIEGE